MHPTLRTLSILAGICLTLLSLVPLESAAERTWQEVSTAELQVWMAGGDPPLLINVLPKIIHDLRHIPGSINVPLGKLRESPLMPADREKSLVFYCMGAL